MRSGCVKGCSWPARQFVLRLILGALSLGLSHEVRAGDPGSETASPSPSAPAEAVSPAAALEERFKKLEERYDAMERRHAEKYSDLSKKYEELRKQVQGSPERKPDAAPRTSTEGGAGARDNPPDAIGPKNPGAGSLLAPNSDTSRIGGEGARDNLARPSDTPGKSKGPTRLPVKVSFGPGFDLRTENDEFELQFHILSQIDARLYSQSNQDPVHSGFSFPRERLYFAGRLTKPIEYYLTLNRGFGALDLFDSFINFHYDDRFMLKVGRFKTPFSYEFYALSAPDFLVPERSLFQTNFSPNRQIGLMGWGQLFAKRLDYAAGIFNGNRLSFQDTNEPKDVIAYLNARPFLATDGKWSFLKNLNLGGSVDFGNENNVPLPGVLRTSVAASNAADAQNVAPPFLAFNKNVLQNGNRSLWGLHAAYFYKRLSLIAEWDGGYDTFSKTGNPYRTRVPLNGYYVAAGFFLTGETVERRTQVRPIHPFSLKRGEFGLGAVEMVARYSEVDLGSQVFTGGFADPNLWTNHASTIDVGANWYLNEYAKITLTWEHVEFATPVFYRPGGLQLTSDLFWARFQVYF